MLNIGYTYTSEKEIEKDLDKLEYLTVEEKEKIKQALLNCGIDWWRISNAYENKYGKIEGRKTRIKVKSGSISCRQMCCLRNFLNF